MNEELKALLTLKDINSNHIYNLECEIYKRKELIKQLDNVIYNKCQHKWVLDYSGCGPCDSADRVCATCNLSR